MIGLAEAKKVIKKAVDYFKVQKMFKDRGISENRPSMHMVFSGSPGTAKTTVARLFAKIMKDNGVLSVGGMVEVGRADVVGKYVGWTAQIVRNKFKEAKGSVLFIDEAYSLVDDRNGLYGDEAINTIVQDMENRREDIVVIFAGYTDKMEEFLQRTPGLRSRIAFHVPFDGYNADELLQILTLMAKKQSIKMDADVNDKLVPIVEKAMKDSDFGNGRYMRTLLEQARMNQASRLLTMETDSITKEDLVRLVADDFSEPPQLHKEKKQIGFF
jgi:AAA+ superfamily predicted ATPase